MPKKLIGWKFSEELLDELQQIAKEKNKPLNSYVEAVLKEHVALMAFSRSVIKEAKKGKR